MIENSVHIFLGEGDVAITPASGTVNGKRVLGVSFSRIPKMKVGPTNLDPPTADKYMESPVVIHSTTIESIDVLINALEVAKKQFLKEEFIKSAQNETE